MISVNGVLCDGHFHLSFIFIEIKTFIHCHSYMIFIMKFMSI